MQLPASLGSLQFVRYCMAGGVAAAAHLAVLATLVETLAVDPPIASAIGFGVAVLVNYSLQYRYTFAATNDHGSALLKFSAIACCGLAINTGLFWLSHTVAGLPYLFAQIVATGLVVLFNFSLNRRFVFVAQEL